MSNFMPQRETITVLKPKTERFSDASDNKAGRLPKLTIGYYILNLKGIQSGNSVRWKLVSTNPNRHATKNDIGDDLNFISNYDHFADLNSVCKRDADVFDSTIDVSEITNTCKEYHSITKVELPNQQLTSVPNDVWKLSNKFSNAEGKHIKILNNIYLNDKISNAINRYPIRVLDLSCNYLKQISGEIKNLFTLQILNLSNNQLTSLPNELIELHELEELHLSYNLFQSIPKILYKLQNLRFLFVNCNYISTIDKEFKFLNQLQVFDISQNNLYSWPYPVLTSKTVIELNLDNNKISIVPDQIHNMKSLKYLRLKNNHIRRLPKMHKMNSLEIIDMTNNSIQSFPDFYGSINLREIRLDHNQVQKMDCNCLFGTVTHLLSISFNKLNEITGHLSLIDTIRYLDISNNELKSIPHDFCYLNRIKSIKLNGNNFHDPNIIKYNEFGALNLVEYLMKVDTEKSIDVPDGPRYAYIDRCDQSDAVKSDHNHRCLKLTMDSNGHLPNWMFRRAEHEEVLCIDLSMNKHAQLPSQLWKLAQYLEQLYAGNNSISKLPQFICHFVKLRILDLYDNHLTALPQELVFCKELSFLNISRNKFTELPPVIFNMKKLKALIVTENSIKEVNVELLRKLKKVDISKNCIQKFIIN